MYIRELGQGKTSVVYLFESDSGKKIAVKTFKPGPSLDMQKVI
jgi:RIO-like serine/threonine protein kinase